MEVFVVAISIHNMGNQSLLYNYYCFAFWKRIFWIIKDRSREWDNSTTIKDKKAELLSWFFLFFDFSLFFLTIFLLDSAIEEGWNWIIESIEVLCLSAIEEGWNWIIELIEVLCFSFLEHLEVDQSLRLQFTRLL